MMNANRLIARAEEKAVLLYQAPLQALESWQLHQVLGEALMEDISPAWQNTRQNRESGKQAYYLSMEYLIGRMIFNNLYCAGMLKEADDLLKEKGIDLRQMEDIEDYAFGNGGLGRLAACYLDSAATKDIPLLGYGLRYKYGLFKQSFSEGLQKEAPDDWSRFGDPFSLRRYDLRISIEMGDLTVVAVPYDMPVIGYRRKSIGTLRLWQAEAPEEVDFPLFNAQRYAEAASNKNKAEDLCKFLYPNDSGDEGKLMRIRQEYLLSAASLRDILRDFVRLHGKAYDKLPQLAAIQLNDTHPAMAIPELIRLLLQEGLSFETAFDITQNTFAYTNHTVMSEALEKWEARLLKLAVPHLYPVIRRINQRLLKEQNGRNKISLIKNQRVSMADLSIYASRRTNGVAEIHSRILKDSVFKDWYALYPDRFCNVTNGITQRRWLALCNPELTALIEKTLGTDEFIHHLPVLSAGRERISDDLARDFIRVKGLKKSELAEEIKRREGIDIPAHFIFDVQIKRLHEYKRQLMNAISIMAIYQGLKDGSIKDFTPTAFIFGAKAAPGYARAKAVIYYINQMAALINSDPDMKDWMRVVFVHNYNCSYAEKIIPAADISEQISPAGTEASGTGNMKLMLGGAVTLGTFDGANVEIVEEAGLDNNYIFGATVEEIRKLSDYSPKLIYKKNAVLQRAVDTLIDGTFKDGKGDGEGTLKELHNSLLTGASWHKPDHYFIFLDFDGYMKAKLKANRDYRDSLRFAKKCLYNVFSAAKFSSDRSVEDYARDIWGL